MKPTLLRLFDLNHDQKAPEAIDRSIRQGMRMEGTNLWVLIFAILIASIGLNVNSTAVIIGAMLVSPLMGPITAIGYGAGINDFGLIKGGLRNLGIFAGISLMTSSLYFLISPLSEAQTELLARTSPTLWDVLVAFFGGAAGIVAMTRKDISPVIPGVAIATALMPPLCTAGYGLAIGGAKFFWGAAYLFTINSVFIAFATLLVVKILKLPKQLHVNERTQHKTRVMIGLCVTATLLPSAYLAYKLVQDEVFYTSAQSVVRELNASKDTILLGHSIDKEHHQIVLTLGGKPPKPGFSDELESRINRAGVPQSTVLVRHLGGDRIDVASLKKELEQNMVDSTVRKISTMNQNLQTLMLENKSLKAKSAEGDQIIDELRAQYPEAVSLVVGQAKQRLKNEAASRDIKLVLLTTRKALPQIDQDRIRAWLKVRWANESVRVVFERGSMDTLLAADTEAPST